MSKGESRYVIISVEGPILPGTISSARSKCGKLNCICKAKHPKLHGPYYRWTGIVNRKQTTKTLSKEIAKECNIRIKNYRKLRSKIKALIKQALQNAPWRKKDIQ